MEKFEKQDGNIEALQSIYYCEDSGRKYFRSKYFRIQYRTTGNKYHHYRWHVIFSCSDADLLHAVFISLTGINKKIKYKLHNYIICIPNKRPALMFKNPLWYLYKCVKRKKKKRTYVNIFGNFFVFFIYYRLIASCDFFNCWRLLIVQLADIS